jgi:hypothetical protein
LVKYSALCLTKVVALLGEQFTYNEDISGAVISLRKSGDRISIWTRSTDNEEKTMATGLEFKKVLDTRDKIGFQSHSDTSVKVSRFVSFDVALQKILIHVKNNIAFSKVYDQSFSSLMFFIKDTLI